jgi:hypothetical protein
MNADQLIQRARILLGDKAGLKFSREQLEAALSSVLAQVNSQVPHIVTMESMQAVVDHTLTLESETAIRDVLQVECLDFQPARRALFTYQEAGSTQIRLTETWPSAQTMTWRIKLVTDHQLEGLDGALTSTIPTSCELLLAYGMASRALQMRSVQLAESANSLVSSQVGERQAGEYETHFEALLRAWQQGQPVPMAVLPQESGWQDRY